MQSQKLCFESSPPALSQLLGGPTEIKVRLKSTSLQPSGTSLKPAGGVSGAACDQPGNNSYRAVLFPSALVTKKWDGTYESGDPTCWCAHVREGCQLAGLDVFNPPAPLQWAAWLD